MRGNYCLGDPAHGMRYPRQNGKSASLNGTEPSGESGASRGEFFETDAAGDVWVNRKDYGRKQRKRGLFTSGKPCRVAPEKARSELRPDPQRRLERRGLDWRNGPILRQDKCTMQE